MQKNKPEIHAAASVAENQTKNIPHEKMKVVPTNNKLSDLKKSNPN
jgi:hypothetical protein